ncbi:MAG: S8 family serine peptidase, partial [Candidatus Udaeobacter sp.]
GGKYAGVAPGAQLVGLSAGDLNLSFVLAGFDYLLNNGRALNVRVVNCSFSANTVFDFNDPVNIATRLLTENGINVVFSAGNTGSGAHTLNPYAVAPWVISVGASDERGRLANFSSRGDFGSPLFQPTLVAPGVSIASLRTSSSPSLAGLVGLTLGDDAKRLSLGELPFYTTGSGTSFSAPQVAGTIALMLEANPNLTPAQVRDILKRTATPLPGYYAFEVGAGMLNAYGSVVEAANPDNRAGKWRALLNSSSVAFVNDPVQQFSGTVNPSGVVDAAISVSANTLFASVQLGWGSLLSANQIGLSVYDPSGKPAAQENEALAPGLTGGRKSAAVRMPASGAWKARVSGALGAPQSYHGLIQLTRVEYGPLRDLSDSDGSSRDEILQVVRTFVMSPIGSRFRPDFTVSRADLAETLVRGGCAPQYLPSVSHYPDVRDTATRLFAESVQAAPNGPFIYNSVYGEPFRPDDRLDRLTAAVALVRAAGLRSEAEAKSGMALSYLDTLNVPSQLRGYVATAISHGLLSADTLFRPQSALTRGELAHAMVMIAKMSE